MKRRHWTAWAATALYGAVAAPAGAQGLCGPPRPPGLGRGFHLGEVIGRSAQDYAALATLGATLVRFGLPLALGPDALSFAWPAAAWQELQRQIGFARGSGVRIIPVLRPAAEPEAPLWASSLLQDSLDQTWRRMTEQLCAVVEVAAFDLVNEPHPPGYGFAHKQSRWDALAERLIRSVRSVDRDRRIVLEPSPGARPMAFRTATRLPFEGLVYSTHMYEPFEFTHQRVGDARFTAVVDYPGRAGSSGDWQRSRLEAELLPVQRFGEQHGVEILVGEFGAVRWAPPGARERYLQDLLMLFERWGWSWTYHAWREWHGWDAEMDARPEARARRTEEGAIALLRQALSPCEAAHGR